MVSQSVPQRPWRVALFATCLVDAFCPEVGEATVRLLRRLGLQVDFPQAQTCCGQPAFNAGFRHQARAVARRNLEILAGYDYVVVPSGSCTAMLRCFTPELFADTPALAAQAQALAARTYELSEFLVRVVGVERIEATFAGKVAYHASCHLLRELGVKEEPRRLLAQVQGLELVPMELAEQCCGFGGTFAVKYPTLSDAMLRKKLAALQRAGADTLVSCDSGCLLHLAGRLHRQGEGIRVLHLAQVLQPTTEGP
ncbi:MAG: iron-sulfur protein [Candidatus Tectimicrobiota bacterium]|nr:MAG: iron-sulfur protein [Candidatus Tectomicrobia bacterium]